MNRHKKLEDEDLTDGSNKTQQTAKECGGGWGSGLKFKA